MTIRFAAANPAYNPVIARVLGCRPPLRAANDNSFGICDDKLLKAALRHFAEHGLSAADHARMLAEEAFFDGDSENYRWWLSICRTLDRRMAEAVSARMDSSAADRTGRPAGNLA